MIAIADGGMRPFHAFDTFEGFPKRKSELDGEMLEGTGKADYETVKRYLSSFRGIHLYKGIFPDTATPINNLSFSFVHLDCDVYTPIKAGLEFFYPRMVKGGILISHDYNYKGVRSAFDEVMSNKPEPLMTFSAGAQVMFVKLN